MPIEPFIKCSDLPVSVRFYTETLDFNIIVPPDSNPEAFMSMYSLINRDGSAVHLSAHAGDGVFGSLNYVRVADLGKLYAGLLARGLKVVGPDDHGGVTMEPVEQIWGMKEFAVKDPDGNKWVFGQSST